MRLAIFAFLATVGVQSILAEAPQQPGQLASVVLPSIDAQPLISVLPREGTQSAAQHHDRNMNRLWIASMAAALATTSADAATSWGKMEGNSLLASSNGEFGMRAVTLKAGFAAALIVPQLILHKNKSLRTKFMICNFVEAGIFTGVSIHNLGVTAPAN